MLTTIASLQRLASAETTKKFSAGGWQRFQQWWEMTFGVIQSTLMPPSACEIRQQHPREDESCWEGATPWGLTSGGFGGLLSAAATGAFTRANKSGKGGKCFHVTEKEVHVARGGQPQGKSSVTDLNVGGKFGQTVFSEKLGAEPSKCLACHGFYWES